MVKIMRMFICGMSTGNYSPLLPKNELDLWIMSCMTQGVLMFDGNYSLEGRIVEKYEINLENNTIDFYLKEMTWSDGTKLSTEDFVITYKTIFDPSAPDFYAKNYDFIVGVEEYKNKYSNEIVGIQKISDKHLRILCKTINGSVLNKFTSPIVPAHIFKNIDVSQFFKGNEVASNIGCGAYIYTKFENNIHYLSSNKDFHLGSPKIENLEIFEGTQEKQLEMIMKGEIDFSIIDRNIYKKVKQCKQMYDFYAFESLMMTTISFNYRKEIFKNINIRQYINSMIDREKIVEEIYDGSAIAANQIYPSLVLQKYLNSSECVLEVENAYNVQEELVLTLGYREYSSDLENIAQYFAGLNGIVKFVPVKVENMYDAFIIKNVDLYLHNTNCFFAPYVSNMYEEEGSYVEITGLKDEILFEMTQNLKANDSINAMKKYMEYIAINVPSVFIANIFEIQIIKKGFTNLKVDSRGVLWNIHEIDKLEAI